MHGNGLRRLLAWGLGALAVLALFLVNARGGPSDKPPPSPAPEPGAPALPTLSAPYRDAAAAQREHRCADALEAVAPLIRESSSETPFARLVEGLHAHACDDPERAYEALFLGGGRGTPLEDWRLLILADSASALEEWAVAHAALDKLLTEYPSSPLYPRAYEKAVEVARGSGATRRALELAEKARDDVRLPQELTLRLERELWEIASEIGNEWLRREVALRLLVEAPDLADELEVSEAFGRPVDNLDWAQLLDPDEIVERARALNERRRFEESWQLLEAVPPPQRSLEWRLAAARALSGDERGQEALEVLAGVVPGDGRRAAAVEWARAQAAAEVATVRRGRAPLSRSSREQFRQLSRDHLARVVRLGADDELTVRALRSLFADHVAAERFEEAMATLAALERLFPEDETGASFLWRRGWEAYSDRNESGAVGYWAELLSLYPDSRWARQALYWSGRAYEKLGESARSRELYRRVAATQTPDFYRKYALLRLGEEPAATPTGASLPWPEDPGLDRALLLSDLGLDHLALLEIELSRDGVDGRAASALESIVLARLGDRRSSIGRIREAFPELGGPGQASVPARAQHLYYPLAYQDVVRVQAEALGLPLHLLLGMIRQESGFDPSARSRAGARGLLQLMPATGREVARRIGLPFSHRRLEEPSFNLRLGATYFRHVLTMFDGNVELALAGYNGGPYRIKRLWRRAGDQELDEFVEGLQVQESRIYVKRILLLSESYRMLYDLAPDRRAQEPDGVPRPSR